MDVRRRKMDVRMDQRDYYTIELFFKEIIYME